ncbi:DUF3857 domain-containing protein [Fodinibius halophilus]|uniref:DUF3857 domain-containing protein n=1 Tax=Fodinibius halophilus TaxID=1736908 RepID=A0A6M1T5D0_9BACT|nr:DUF3857 domain-containing protein [Fodinibius halophilus]NGP89277.1 DUF3857 domain-containing protein [Fodinibius halophilus]
MLKVLYRYTLIIGVSLFMLTSGLYGQSFQDADFGVIPDSLYQLSPSDAPYVITNKEMDVSFNEEDGSIVAILDHHVRLKVFDKTAREASIVSIPYYYDDNMEQISDISGWTHLPSGNQIALRQSDIRTVNINSRYNIKEFTMPAVSNGAILEYRYKIKRRYIEELPDFFLSHRVPTEAAKLTITYPNYLRYQQLTENYSGSLRNNFVYTDTSSVPKIFTIPQPKPIVTERWMAYDIPATEKEPYITSLDDHRAKLKFMMSEFGIPRQTLDIGWDVVVAKLRKNTNPLAEIRKNSFAHAKGDSIASAHPNADLKEIQNHIFRYLNKRMSFSGAHAPYSSKRGRAVIEGEVANQAAINQALAAMLRGAGIDANPVLVSTRKSGTINKGFPSFYQFNGLMVRSHIEGKTYVMDASFAHSQPGLIPVDMFNDEGLELKPRSFEWFKIEPAHSHFDLQVDVEAKLTAEGTLKGTIVSHQQGYPAQQIRQQRTDGMTDSDIVSRALFDGYADIRLDSVEIQNLNRYKSPVKITAHFEIEDYATSFSNGLEYRPMVVGYRMNNPFGDASRDLPVTLDAPEQLDVSYSIALPSGFSVDDRSQDQSLKMDGGQFRERYNLEPGTLNYNYQIKIGRKNFSPQLFPQLYNLYERWVQLSNSKWLIKR